MVPARRAVDSRRGVAVGPYSHAIDSEPFLFCSGQTPIDHLTGRLVGGGIGPQTDCCLDNLFDVLASAGLGPNDVVKVNVYLVDMGDFDAMNEVYRRRFAEPFPARTTVGVAALPLGAAVEIELVARRPGPATAVN